MEIKSKNANIKSIIVFFLLLITLTVAILPSSLLLLLLGIGHEYPESLTYSTLTLIAIILTIASFLMSKRGINLKRSMLISSLSTIVFLTLPSLSSIVILPLFFLSFSVVDILQNFIQTVEVLILISIFSTTFTFLGALIASYKTLDKKLHSHSLILLLLLSFSFIFSLPIIEESTEIGLFCTGSGCSSSGEGGNVLPAPQASLCNGYRFSFLCLSDKEKYCFYTSPLFMDKCLCEAVRGYENVYRKFCEKDKKCYENSWEYEFGSSENVEDICEKVENELSQREEVYKISNNSQRIEIFKEWNLWRGFGGSPLEGESILVKDICNHICQNCNSSLCNRGHVCEYVNYPIPNTKRKETI